jgi:hypothetical protein
MLELNQSPKLSWLKSLNKYAFILHFLSALGIIYIFSTRDDNANFDINLYSYRVTKIEGDNDNDLTFSFGTKDDPKIDVYMNTLKIIIIMIFIITAAFHLFYWKSSAYTNEINNGYNRFRWLEYSITATLMIFILAIISGVKEYYAVFELCTISIALMMLGYFLEQTDKFQVKLVSLLLGWFLLTVTFVVLFTSLIKNVEDAEDVGKDIPGWVKFVLLPMLLWWMTFGIVSIFQTLNYNKLNYTFLTYEKWYILLSFLSKLFMGYYISFGLTRKKSENKN